MQAVASNRPVTLRALAAESGVHEDTASDWRRKPGFLEWWESEFMVDVRGDYALMMARGFRRAITTGDPREIEIMARISGKLAGGPMFPLDPLGDRGQVVGVQNNYQLNFLIPRPEVPQVPR